MDIDAYLDSCISIGKTKLINRINTIDALNDSQLDKREQGDMHSEYETASTELKTLVMSSLNKLFNKKRDLKIQPRAMLFIQHMFPTVSD